MGFPQVRLELRAWSESLEARRFLAFGDVDTSFNGTGVATLSPAGSINYDVARSDTDGSFALLGWFNTSAGTGRSAGRFSSAGAYDANFVAAYSNFGSTSLIEDSLIQPDGKVVLLRANGAIIRMTTTGAMDSTFSEDGFAHFPPEAGVVVVNSIDRLADGTMLIGGKSSGGTPLAYLIDSSGQPVTSFGTSGNGVSFIGVPADAVASNASTNRFRALLQSDGKILLVGTVNKNSLGYVAITRLTSAGVKDTSFGTDGWAVHSRSGAFIRDVAQGADGKIVVLSYTNDVVARYLADGTPDTSFGNSWQGYSISPSTDGILNSAGQLAIDERGGVLLAGVKSVSGRNVAHLARLTPAGQYDGAFGTGGALMLNLSPTLTSQAEGILVQPDGRIVVAGRVGSTSYGYLMRLQDATPTVLEGTFTNRTTATQSSVRLRFSEPLALSNPSGAFAVQRFGAGVGEVPPQIAGVVWDADGRGCTVNLSRAGGLLDGNYRLTLSAAAVTDAAGHNLAAAHSFDFFVLAGDATGDRHVDTADQSFVTGNFGLAGMTYVQGDFNGDGTVNAADQAILDANWHAWLPASGVAQLPAGAGADLYRLRRESSSIAAVFDNPTAGAAANPLYRLILGDVTVVSMAGGGGDDTLLVDFSGGDVLPSGVGLQFDGGAGGSDAAIVAGTTGADNASANVAGITIGARTITPGGVERFTFDGRGGWDSLSVAGGGARVMLPGVQQFESLNVGVGSTLALPSGSASTLAARSLVVDGTFDLADNALVLDYSSAGPSPIGSHGGAGYTGLHGLVARGRKGGTWDGSGLRTSVPAAASGLTSLGLGEARDVLNIAAGQTKVWRGHTLDASAVIVRYTYAGDANLDGIISGDDYTAIDFAIATPGAYAWHNGDFNYDGIISGDDYSVIDFNIAAQSSPL